MNRFNSVQLFCKLKQFLKMAVENFKNTTWLWRTLGTLKMQILVTVWKNIKMHLSFQSMYKEDLTRVVISYEMTTTVRFCLSYDRFKLNLIAFKVNIISIENPTLSRTTLWRYMYAPKCYVTCGHTIFMTWRYPLNNCDVIWWSHILIWCRHIVLTIHYRYFHH